MSCLSINLNIWIRNNLADESITAQDQGRRFFLGELYDARTSESLGASLWPLSVLDDPRFVRETSAASADYFLTYADTVKDGAGWRGEAQFGQV